MIIAWMNYILMLALLVIAFVGGTRVGRLQEQQRRAARRRARAARPVPMLRHDPPWQDCGVCGAGPGQPCTPQGPRRVPSRRPER